jgi:hypothetical protein
LLPPQPLLSLPPLPPLPLPLLPLQQLSPSFVIVGGGSMQWQVVAVCSSSPLEVTSDGTLFNIQLCWEVVGSCQQRLWREAAFDVSGGMWWHGMWLCCSLSLWL